MPNNHTYRFFDRRSDDRHDHRHHGHDSHHHHSHDGHHHHVYPPIRPFPPWFWMSVDK